MVASPSQEIHAFSFDQDGRVEEVFHSIKITDKNNLLATEEHIRKKLSLKLRGA